VGVAVEVGKDVEGFAKGDRCVADVGITVSVPTVAKQYILTTPRLLSATGASTAVVASRCFAKTSGQGESAPLAALPSTLPSEFIPATWAMLTCARSPQHKLYKINKITDLEATLGKWAFSIHRIP
jgi:hypothetical protein